MQPKEPHEIALEEADFAYHEAGHAVVAFLEGLSLTEISIESNAVPCGRTISEGQGIIGPNDPYDRFIKQIVVANAGFIAVKRRRGIQVDQWPTQELIVSWGGISDLSLIHEATLKICKSKNEITAFKLWTYFRCERFIDEAWIAVEALGKELLTKKRLDKNEIEAILNTFDWQIVPE